MKILILISLFITTTLAQTEHDDAIILTLEHQNSIQLDSTLLNFFEENLTRVRSTFDTLKTVQAFPPYAINQLLLQTFAAWAEPWKKGELLTGNDAIDSLSALYGLNHAEGDDYGMFLLQYDQPLKIDKLALLYQAIDSIVYASPNHSSGDGDRIEYFYKNGKDHFVFSKGWGDCPAGCVFRYYWYVEMKDSSARLVAENPKEYIDSRFYTWNIPERFSMTHFNSADAIIDSIQFSERWWIQQHSIEGSWRFFIYDSPRYYVDENARWPSLQKSIKGQVHELLSVLERVQYNSDQDVAASAVYAIQQIRSVTSLDVRKDFDYIAVNDCKMWFGNNGRGSSDPATSGPGFFWPGGEDATQSAIFADGLMWGGLIDGVDTVANGNTFRAGLQPGNILDNGKPADKNDAQFGIWKARKDWQALVDGPVKDRLKYDWENWPVHLGAPWKDNDNDGVYDPQIDEPDIAGDETNWMVMNDLDTAMTLNTYGSNPLSLEIRLSIYAYNQDNDLKDVVFKKYQLYNKGQNFIKDMYLGYWSDPDLGHAGDDYSGCDTTLDLAYTWNGLDEDRVYGSQPPAQGYLMLQGPVRPAMDEQAFYFDRYIDGYRNNSLSGFAVWDYSFLKVFDPFCDCIIRDFMTDPSYGIKAGSREYYNCLMGRSTMKGFKFIDPNSSQPVDIVLSGDPVAGTGWYMGDGWPGGPNPDDVRLLMSSGPFDFAPGDSQEVVYAIIMARGENNLDSITELKRKAAAVKEFYYTGVLPSAIEEAETAQPKRFSLSQNYPNPFNPTTTIEYTVGANNHSPLPVSLKIYDVLGREVKTLVNKNQSAGKYRVTIDGNGLASGIYYYRLETGDFMQTRKMLLLR